MRTAIYFWFGFLIPCEERLRLIKQVGFDDVMLWWGDDMEEVNGPKAKLADLARSYGLGIESAHLPYINANQLWLEGLDAEDLFKLYAGSIESAAASEIPTLVMHLTEGDILPDYNSLGLERMKRLCDLAERFNVTLALENVRANAHLDYIFSNIDSRRLKFCYDSGHENCYNPAGRLLVKYASRLVTVHLHDNNVKEDQHLIPGYGTIKWSEVIKDLRTAGYTGSIAPEVTPSE